MYRNSLVIAPKYLFGMYEMNYYVQHNITIFLKCITETIIKGIKNYIK